MKADSPMMPEVLAVLPDSAPGLTPKQVHTRVGRWSLISVRHCLRELVRAGRATFDGPDCQRRYWRCTAVTDPSGGGHVMRRTCRDAARNDAEIRKGGQADRSFKEITRTAPASRAGGMRSVSSSRGIDA